MATEITMPKLGLTMKVGRIGKWFKKEGDLVKKGEAIAEVLTDKITNVLEAAVEGVLLRIAAPVGTQLASRGWGDGLYWGGRRERSRRGGTGTGRRGGEARCAGVRAGPGSGLQREKAEGDTRGPQAGRATRRRPVAPRGYGAERQYCARGRGKGLGAGHPCSIGPGRA